MEVQYRQSFLKDLKKLKGQPVYDKIFVLAFTTLTEVEGLSDLTNVKAMKGYPNRYRLRIGDHRVGVEVHGETVEVIRALHRREFYRYFP
jgi:mRNA-degrading endonuclease RelE of RelBE toxin-antitoxin system